MAIASKSSEGFLRNALPRLLPHHHHHHQAPASLPSLFSNSRLMSSCQVFVGGLSWGTDDDSLKAAFTSFGEVMDARVITDRDTGRSRGFGFVSFASSSDAEAAIQSMDGRDLAGRIIQVSYATGRSAMGRGGSGGSYGGGSSGFGSSPYSGASSGIRGSSFPDDESSYGRGGSYGDSSFGRSQGGNDDGFN